MPGPDPHPDMSATPFGSAPTTGASTARHSHPPELAGPVWVLEDVRGVSSDPCLAIAERLGAEFRRVPLCWDLRHWLARLPRAGSIAGLRSILPLAADLPALTLSAGPRAAAVAAWLKHACGSTLVHYGAAGRHAALCDLQLRDTSARGSPTGAMVPVLGAPHRLSALQFGAARHAWRDRLDHLPHPRLALVLGGGSFGAETQPIEAVRLARKLAASVAQAQGAILAIAEPQAGREATDALSAGLAGCMHLLHRAGEPGTDPSLGFLASADAVVIAGTAPDRLLQACALTVPVYVSHAGPLQQRLFAAGHVRLLDSEIGTWRRAPLDEAGRAADLIRERL